RVFVYWDSFPELLGGAIVVDDMIVAYTIAEPLDGDTVVIHFEKGCPAHKGIYQAINQMFLESLEGRFRYVNREQDLGDEGLRKAKMSYHPVKFNQKYRIALRA
ncbi:MAG: phosphatidylglycerol lysyltransferase domain-containing protein, partial [Desulfobacterales bacterium]